MPSLIDRIIKSIYEFRPEKVITVSSSESEEKICRKISTDKCSINVGHVLSVVMIESVM